MLKSLCKDIFFSPSIDLNAIPLDDCELVLGTQLLRTLGLIQWDFLAMSMEFHYFNSTVRLQGLQPSSLTLQEGT